MSKGTKQLPSHSSDMSSRLAVDPRKGLNKQKQTQYLCHFNSLLILLSCLAVKAVIAVSSSATLLAN